VDLGDAVRAIALRAPPLACFASSRFASRPYGL
jgi:hypothetical protein